MSDLLVLHVGNAPESGGGISSVIRAHLRRPLPGVDVRSVVTHVERARPVARVRIWLSALRRVAAADPGAIVHVHLAQRGSLVREGIAVVVARVTRHPVVVTLHGSSLLGAGRGQRLLVRFLCARADLVHGYSERYRARFGVPTARWLRLPNDVGIPERSSRDRPMTVLFLGEVGLRKGVDLLAEAWDAELARRAELVIAGPITPEAAPAIEALAARPGVRVLGAVSHDVALALLAETALLVQPSRAEAFPMSVCEAMAAGCAVVGTDVGGLGELLAAAGQPIVPAEARDLRASLCAVLADRERLLELRLRAGAYARRELATEVVSQRWLETYLTLGRSRRVLAGAAR